jgi:hypothetical protein
MNSAVEPMSFLAGTESLGSHLDGWNLNGEPPHEGDRSYRARVVFARAFRDTPLVHIAISGLDASNLDAVRVSASATGISPEGFDIVLSTWMDSRLWRVDVNWLAIGPN